MSYWAEAGRLTARRPSALTDSSSADSLTGEINPATAYAGTPIKLPALIDHSPSEAMRKKLGLEIDVDATLIIATRHVENNSLSIAIGDAFDLPPDNDRLYVTKVVPSYQSGNLFLAYLLAVSRKQGRR